MQRMQNIKIFFFGENANGFSINEQEISNLEKFKNVPILKNIADNYQNGKIEVIGIIEEATRIEGFYVYGNIALFQEEKEIKYIDFKNYEIAIEKVENQKLIGVDILGIEFEIII